MPPRQPKNSAQSSKTHGSNDFAPAFAKKRQIPSEPKVNEVQQSDFRFLRTANSGLGPATWSTYDPDTRKRVWTRPETQPNQSQSDSLEVWNWTSDAAQPRQTVNGEVIASAVASQFVDDHAVMAHIDRPRSEFERRNADLTGHISGSQIISQFGDQSVVLDRKSDTRIMHMDRNGNYIDGIDRGQVAKRLREEQSRRIAELDREKLRANKIWQSFHMLSPQEQAQLIAQSKRNVQITLASLDMEEEEEETPPSYAFDVKDMMKRVQGWDMSRSAQLGGSTDRGSNRLVPGDVDSTLGAGSSRPLYKPRPITYGAEGYVRPEPVISRETETGRHPSHIRRESMTARASSSIYDFKVWPKLVPIQESDEVVPVQDTEDLVNYHQLERACRKAPRVVSIALADPNVRYSSVAFLERIFGGAIQELQFFPRERQAVVVFIYPSDAEAFLTHISCAARSSRHEYIRLQIGASWYKGARDEATLPSQNSVLSWIVAENATRTLRVAGINKCIRKDDLLNTLKSRLSALNIVRAKLIVPTKDYERAPIESNSVVLEFASISQARDAKARFDRNQVIEFEGKRTNFLRDASVAPKPRLLGCECLHCTSPSETGTGDTVSEASWSRTGRSTDSVGIWDRPPIDDTSMSGFVAANLGKKYKPRRDAARPAESGYKHDDVKRSRLQ